MGHAVSYVASPAPLLHYLALINSSPAVSSTHSNEYSATGDLSFYLGSNTCVRTGRGEL